MNRTKSDPCPFPKSICHFFQSSNASNLVDGLQRLFAMDVNLAVGKSITAAMLNEKGNYVVVADIHRLNDSR